MTGQEVEIQDSHRFSVAWSRENRKGNHSNSCIHHWMGQSKPDIQIMLPCLILGDSKNVKLWFMTTKWAKTKIPAAKFPSNRNKMNFFLNEVNYQMKITVILFYKQFNCSQRLFKTFFFIQLISYHLRFRQSLSIFTFPNINKRLFC